MQDVEDMETGSWNEWTRNERVADPFGGRTTQWGATHEVLEPGWEDSEIGTALRETRETWERVDLREGWNENRRNANPRMDYIYDIDNEWYDGEETTYHNNDLPSWMR